MTSDPLSVIFYPGYAQRALAAPLPPLYCPSMLHLTRHIAIDESELKFAFVHSTGPGGQNVNKVATAVQMRFDVRRSPSLPEGVRQRLERLAGRRLTQDGVLVITAVRFRSQERNRQDAIERLAELVQQASVAPVLRRPTKPTAGSHRRRLEGKERRSTVKSMRGKPDAGD